MLKKIIFFIVTFLALTVHYSIAGNVTFIINKLPQNHPSSEKVYLAGTINNWQADHPEYQFKFNEDKQLTLTIPFKSSGDLLQFKLTRGSWASQELDANRYTIDNRTFTYHLNKESEILTVDNWEDLVGSLGKPSTQTGTVKILTKSVKYQGQFRTLRVYLPPYYQKNDHHYPVMYMFDGQNLFDQSTASVGMEWQVDETLQQMIYFAKTKGMIVVGIDSAPGCDRAKEYTAWPWKMKSCGLIEGSATAHAAFIIDSVKPFIDQHYRTKTQRDFTYIGGSSLGGYMSVFTALTYQQTFSKVMGLSNAVVDEYSGKALKEFIINTKKQLPIQFYLDIGDQEAFSQTNKSQYIVDANKALYQALIDAGFTQDEVTLNIIKGGMHDENSWAKRLASIFTLLGI